MPSRTFLQLAQKLRQECEVAGVGPSAITSQTGQLKRLVDWVADGWVDLQNRHGNWQWLRSEWSVNTVAGDDTYAGTDCTDTIASATVTRFSKFWTHDEEGYPNVKGYLQASGVGTERWLEFLPWADFRARYKIGTQNNGQPMHFTIDPRRALVIGPKPDAVYVLSGEYQKSAQTLAADADVPELPADYHDLLVFYAMQRYGANSVAQEIYVRGATESRRMLIALEANQLPAMSMAGPMA